MNEMTSVQDVPRDPAMSISGPMRFLLRRFTGHFANVSVPFDLKLPDGSIINFGKGTPKFHIHAKTQAGAARAGQPRRRQVRRRLCAGRHRHGRRHAGALRAARHDEGHPLHHLGVALHPAAAVRPGAHQQEGDQRALRSRSGPVPQLPRSDHALLHPGCLSRTTTRRSMSRPCASSTIASRSWG